MGDISIKGKSPLLKVKQIDPLASRLTEAGHTGGAGKSLKTKSDYRLKNQLKKIQKTPDKKFKEPKEKPTTPEEKTTTEEKQNLKGGGIASGMRRFNRGGKV